MSDRVWIVSQSSYPNYRIMAIFSTKERADAYAATLDPQRDPEVVDWTVDPEYSTEEIWWYVYATEDGIELVDRVDEEPANPVNVFTYHEPRWERDEGMWIGVVQAPTRDRAVQIAGEQLAMAKAQAAGIT